MKNARNWRENPLDAASAENKAKKSRALRFAGLFLAVCAAVMMTGCGAKEEKMESSVSEVVSEPVSESVSQVSQESKPQESEKKPEASTEAKEKKPEGDISPISGLTLTKEEAARRPVAVMFDNSYAARPQSGLGDAEWCFEYYVEGQTRYMGIFLKNMPEKVGPVRSARPYFLDEAMAFDAIYCHFGGSGQALQEIEDWNVASVNGIYLDGSVYWRSSDREAPHNAYTSLEAVREYAAKQGFSEDPLKDGYRFGDMDLKDADSAKGVTLLYAGVNDTTEYEYVPEDGTYKRYKDGDLHVDANTDEPLKVSNVIVEYCPSEVIDSYGHLAVHHVGTGDGVFFRDGKTIPVTWKREERDTLTRYYDEAGKEIVLKPGQTWVQVLNSPDQVEITK